MPQTTTTTRQQLVELLNSSGDPPINPDATEPELVYRVAQDAKPYVRLALERWVTRFFGKNIPRAWLTQESLAYAWEASHHFVNGTCPCRHHQHRMGLISQPGDAQYERGHTSRLTLCDQHHRLTSLDRGWHPTLIKALLNIDVKDEWHGGFLRSCLDQEDCAKGMLAPLINVDGDLLQQVPKALCIECKQEIQTTNRCLCESHPLCTDVNKHLVRNDSCVPGEIYKCAHCDGHYRFSNHGSQSCGVCNQPFLQSDGKRARPTVVYIDRGRTLELAANYDPEDSDAIQTTSFTPTLPEATDLECVIERFGEFRDQIPSPKELKRAKLITAWEEYLEAQRNQDSELEAACLESLSESLLSYAEARGKRACETLVTRLSESWDAFLKSTRE